MTTAFNDNRGQSEFRFVRELDVLDVVRPRESDGNFSKNKEYMFAGTLDGKFQFVCLNDRRSFAIIADDRRSFVVIDCLIELVDEL